MAKTNASDIARLHKSVLLKEVLEAFGLGEKAHLKREIKIIDATLGLGGHSEAFLEKGATVLGIEADRTMLELARKRLNYACPIPESENHISRGSFKLVYGNFRQIRQIAENAEFLPVDAVIFDLGVSSPQITSQDRGLSYQNKDAELDMRIDPDTQSIKAKDLLNLLRQDQLITLFNKVLGYSSSIRLSKAIVQKRSSNRFETVADLAQVVNKNISKKRKLDVMTLPLMALRIAVNSELENLKEGLNSALETLNNGGKLAVISFHSIEDGIVKKSFKSWEGRNLGRIVNKDIIVPGDAEIRQNPRARSAKMRIFEKHAEEQ